MKIAFQAPFSALLLLALTGCCVMGTHEEQEYQWVRQKATLRSAWMAERECEAEIAQCNQSVNAETARCQSESAHDKDACMMDKGFSWNPVIVERCSARFF